MCATVELPNYQSQVVTGVGGGGTFRIAANKGAKIVVTVWGSVELAFLRTLALGSLDDVVTVAVQANTPSSVRYTMPDDVKSVLISISGIEASVVLWLDSAVNRVPEECENVR